MFFNSIDFAIFLPLVFIIFWLHKDNLKIQNTFLIIVSYIFYGWWDWRFLSLIVLSSIVDFYVGVGFSKTNKKTFRNLLLFTSVFINIGILGYFKYSNFFLDNFIEAFSFFGSKFNYESLHIVLPVGISFYTFQTLSYSIDIYRKKIEPTKDIIAFFAFVSFFPQLVAGPIERASNLLPQFSKKKNFNYEASVDGARQAVWGLFKKIIIADNCAPLVDSFFQNSAFYSGSELFLGVFFFAFQIYCDFSGYSDIAIGISRFFGFSLMQNFAFPYFSRDIAEFWRRWHISLSTWFRDYLYIPLGGSKGGLWIKIRNIFAIFIVSGFWHGANWTFIVWGALNALYFLPLMILSKNRTNIDVIAKNKLLPNIKEILQVILTFLLTLIAWVFFRADNVKEALFYLQHMFSLSLLQIPGYFPKIPLVLIGIVIVTEWFQRHKKHALELDQLKPIYRRFIYVTLFLLFFFFSAYNKQTFIYFQF